MGVGALSMVQTVNSNIIFFFRVHKPRDSILSWGSDFDRYEGVINWGGLLLFLGGLRLSLENFNKYGIRVDPYEWLYALFGHVDIFSEDQEYPTLFIILCKSSSVCFDYTKMIDIA